eukprot:11342947-Alexandrium_andersonii.AAC.1
MLLGRQVACHCGQIVRNGARPDQKATLSSRVSNHGGPRGRAAHGSQPVSNRKRRQSTEATASRK